MTTVTAEEGKIGQADNADYGLQELYRATNVTAEEGKTAQADNTHQ